jgi:uroporphyrinogen decarboxylase
MGGVVVKESPFSRGVSPDYGGLLRAIRREGTPERVHFIELFLDAEVKDEIAGRFGLLEDLDEGDPFFAQRREIALQRFLGYDHVLCGLEGLDMPLRRATAEDTAGLPREGGRSYVDEHAGPVTSWEEFESYPWPDPERASTRALEWYEENLPPDMCVIGGLTGHFAELLSWLMGYETLCYALYDRRDLVRALAERLLEIDRVVVRRLLGFERVRLVWGSDDMGFRTGTLVSPDDLREFVLPGHRELARLSRAAGRPYLLHSCGNLSAVMEDLIEDVGIDARHSFEDTIEDVRDAKARYGRRIALLGGIDVDFLCRAKEPEIRARVRDTLEKCMPGGGYCLGTGNSVANYIPVGSYLAMLDEGRRFGA